ncbi:hypothetical protein [Spiroplasma turonicum]|uniref:Transmembrane protein n=1 Tax=Spiroplasma turonicum TaxID=216946 RepID=A0A0K1P6S3_9MOLU|nr:hypothetical protein [Spiroplasma turonicum]AKU79993.1 hypothetical protein STURON_00747 [Spiroplasma turonicum]ALX70995.1 hypothetical protein STURO_v1c07440 [Spiroplasma turonicum]
MNKRNLDTNKISIKKDILYIFMIVLFLTNICGFENGTSNLINVLIYFDIFIMFLCLVFRIKLLKNIYKNVNTISINNKNIIKNIFFINLFIIIIIFLLSLLIINTSVEQLINISETLNKFKINHNSNEYYKNLFKMNIIILYILCLIFMINIFISYAIAINMYNAFKIFNNYLKKFIISLVILTKKRLSRLIEIFLILSFLLIQKEIVLVIFKIKLFKEYFLSNIYYKIVQNNSYYKWVSIP